MRACLRALPIEPSSTMHREWEPGTQHGYHSGSAAHLFGELGCRIDGRSIDRYLQEEMTGLFGEDHGPGAGGALGFVDPEAKIAFACNPTMLCAGGGIGDRCSALVAALWA